MAHQCQKLFFSSDRAKSSNHLNSLTSAILLSPNSGEELNWEIYPFQFSSQFGSSSSSHLSSSRLTFPLASHNSTLNLALIQLNLNGLIGWPIGQRFGWMKHRICLCLQISLAFSRLIKGSSNCRAGREKERDPIRGFRCILSDEFYSDWTGGGAPCSWVGSPCFGTEEELKRSRRETEEKPKRSIINCCGTPRHRLVPPARPKQWGPDTVQETKRPKQKENGRCGLEAHTPGGDGKVRTVLPTLAFKGFKWKPGPKAFSKVFSRQSSLTEMLLGKILSLRSPEVFWDPFRVLVKLRHLLIDSCSLWVLLGSN